MPDIRAWSTTAADNDDADSNINWLEGQLPSTVNNSARAMMAATRGTFEGPDSKDNGLEWWDSGMTPTRTGNATFTVTGDQTAKFVEGRRLRLTDSATIYATVVSSSYGSVTTVTVATDSGNLSASLAKVFLSPQMPTNVSEPANFDRLNYTTTAGTSTAYTLSPTPALSSLRNGAKVRVKFHTANGATPTLAVSGLTAKTIKGAGNAALAGSEYTADTIAELVYDSTIDAWVGVGAAVAAAASQTAVDAATGGAYVTPPTLAAAAWHGSNLENRIINPEGAILQRSAVGTTDNSYTVDRWRLLLEAANAATVSQITSSLPTQAQYAIRLTAGSGNNNKFGLWQVIEGINCRDMTGQKVYLTFYAKATAGLSNIKAGIVEFTGTEDSVSGDPISSWGADGTTPTLAANYAFLNTPANLSVGTSYAQITTIAVTVGSSMKNLAVFIWNDDKTTTASTDQLEVTMIELRHGAAALPYRARPITVEQELCARYYWRMLQTGSGNTVIGSGYNTSTTNARLGIRLPVPARTTPTIGGGGAGLYVSDITGTVNSSAAAIFGTTAGLAMVNVDLTTSGSLTSGAPCSAFFNTGIDLTFSMEL